MDPPNRKANIADEAAGQRVSARQRPLVDTAVPQRLRLVRSYPMFRRTRVSYYCVQPCNRWVVTASRSGPDRVVVSSRGRYLLGHTAECSELRWELNSDLAETSQASKVITTLRTSGPQGWSNATNEVRAFGSEPHRGSCRPIYSSSSHLCRKSILQRMLGGAM